jgi:hypothetical protein
METTTRTDLAVDEKPDVVDVADVTQTDGKAVADARTVDGRRAAPAPGQLATGRPLVYSDLHCPLLVDDEDKNTTTVVEQLSNAEGEPGGRVLHRVPEQVVTDPVECPTCFKVVERHMLVASPILGTRDCAIAIQARANPRYAKLFGADTAAQAELEAEANKHGKFGQRFLAVFGGKEGAGAEAANAPSLSAGPVDPALVRGENLTDEAAAEHDRLEAQVRERNGDRSSAGGAFPSAARTVAAGPRAAAASEGNRGPDVEVPGGEHDAPAGTTESQPADGSMPSYATDAQLADRETQVRTRMEQTEDPAEKARLADELQSIVEHRGEQGA